MPLPPKTLQTIAEKAGVSKMSVSRALRNQTGVSKELQAKIVSIAEKIGYRPNPLVAALMASRRAQNRQPSAETGTVLAFLERANRPGEARHEHFAGAAKAAAEQGYRLERFIEGAAGLPPDRLNSILLVRNIRGLIIAPLPENQAYFELDWNRFCTVTLEYTFAKTAPVYSAQPMFDRIAHDSYASMRLILQECRTRGLRHIGLCLSQNGRDRTIGLNEAAYWIEQKSTRAFSAIPPLFPDVWDDALFTSWLQRWKPEAIITSGIFHHLIQSRLRRASDRIPKDISIISVNATEPISGIIQDSASIGATATRLVIEKLNRNAYGVPDIANTILVPGSWTEGKTLRPRALAEGEKVKGIDSIPQPKL